MKALMLNHRNIATLRPAQIIAVSFAVVIAVGTLLLMVPASTVQGKSTGLLDALFNATTAIA